MQKDFNSEGTEICHVRDKEMTDEKRDSMKNNVFWGNGANEPTDLRPNRKRSLHAADVISQFSGEMMLLDEKVDFASVDDTRVHKKMKPESRGLIDCNNQEENFGSSLSSNICPFLEPGSSSTTESILFPLDLGPVRDTMRKKSSDGEDPADIPNLELVLGAKKRSPEEEILPLLPANAEDDMAASLSLSLAFHPSEKGP